MYFYIFFIYLLILCLKVSISVNTTTDGKTITNSLGATLTGEFRCRGNLGHFDIAVFMCTGNGAPTRTFIVESYKGKRQTRERER